MAESAESYWLAPESRRLEVKESFTTARQIARTLVAFANGAGGRMVFGMRDEPREVVGIPDSELFPLEEQIAQGVFDNCAPAIIPEIYAQRTDEGNLLVVEVFRGSQKPYYVKGEGRRQGTYVRIGSTTRRASEEMIETLALQSRFVSCDAVPVYDTEWEELDLSGFAAVYEAKTGQALSFEKFRNLGLVVSERDRNLPTRAAVLLTGWRTRKRWFPFSKVECARFKGTTTEVFIDQTTVDGPIYEATEQCVAFVKRNIALGSTIGEVYRRDRWQYPLEAIREALGNAIIHRSEGFN